MRYKDEKGWGLKLETNTVYVPDPKKEGLTLLPDILMTPTSIGNEDYWLFKVQLSEKQSLIAFPKYTGYGIGFEHEEDWNTNLPYQCDAMKIYNHIKGNKADADIDWRDCVSAIDMLRGACYMAVTIRKQAGVIE